MNASPIPEHFFRHEFGRLVAVLARRVGVRNLEMVEDAVQTAMLRALETWKTTSLPVNPSAWLFKAASNQLIGDLRSRGRRLSILKKNSEVPFSGYSLDPEISSENEISDSLLKMVFFCCDSVLPRESQLVLALKSVCGFDVREIALRLFISEENVYKRLSRARKIIKSKNARATNLEQIDYDERIGSVHSLLYALFSEGYLSTHLDFAIRSELCFEAIRLAELVTHSSIGSTPESAALLSLMYFHSARSPARVDCSGGLVLLEDQDRTRWNKQQIQTGLKWLELSARGETYSRYHAEAAIAAEHCLSPSYVDTNWSKIVYHYDLLIALEPSPLHALNRAVAISELHGASAALMSLANVLPPTWLAVSYLWSAVLSDLHYRNGSAELGAEYFRKACAAAPSTAILELLRNRNRSRSTAEMKGNKPR